METRRLLVVTLFLTFVLFGSILSIAHAGGGTALPITIETTPLQHKWLADGTTLYRMDVVIDATQSNEEIMAVMWRFDLPEYLTYVHSEFPSENFYFEGLDLDDPFSDPAFELTENNDGVVVSILGSANVLDLPGVVSGEGILGTYWFTANEDAPVGETQFDAYFSAISYYNHEFPLEECPGGGLDIICSGWADTFVDNPFYIVQPGPPQCPPLTYAVMPSQCPCSRISAFSANSC